MRHKESLECLKCDDINIEICLKYIKHQQNDTESKTKIMLYFSWLFSGITKIKQILIKHETLWLFFRGLVNK